MISIVIPVYNAEKYLNECLNSIVNQTYKNIEIILVNDGSTDTSPDICKEWEKRDSRIIILSQSNSGAAYAKNRGIDIAKGDYILFVDADDYVDKSYAEALYNGLQFADVAICGYSKVEEEQKPILLGCDGLLKREELYFHTVCTNIINGICVNKIFRKEVLQKNNIKFCEKIAIGEDLLFTVEYLEYCNTYYYINEIKYFYRKNIQSAMQNVYYDRKFNEKSISCLECIESLNHITKNEDRKIRNYIGYRAVRSSIWLMLQMILGNKEDKKVFKKIKANCQKNYWTYVNVKCGTLLEKMVGLLLCISPCLVYRSGQFAINRKMILLDNYIE